MINRKNFSKLKPRWIISLIGTLLLYCLLLPVTGQRINRYDVSSPDLADPNLFGAYPVLAAQTSPFDWSYPTRILKRQELTSEPVLVADQSGLVHLFWSPFSTGTQTLFYAQWDGNAWSEPLDIYNDTQILGPSAVVDSQGIIHLVWSDGNTVYYSQAEAADALSANNWSEPMALTYGFQHSQILLDPSEESSRKDRLYLVYPRLASSGPAMITSNDGGYTWSQEMPISLTNSASTGADYVNAAISPDGTVHVVWTEYRLPQGWPPTGLYYSHSNDGGETWSRPLQLAGENYNQINVAVFGDNVVHAAWNGIAGTGGRYHRWSQDGGETWSNPLTVVSPGLGGSEGPPQLGIDSLGTLHLITTFDQRVWYSYFQGQRWSELQYIPSGDETNIPQIGQSIDPKTLRHIEHPAMSLNGGNRLHTVFWDERPDQQFIQYWYTTKLTSASPIDLMPFPTPTAIPTRAISTQSANSGTPVITSTPLPGIENDLDPPSESPALPIIIAVILVLLLVAVIIFIRISKLNRKR